MITLSTRMSLGEAMARVDVGGGLDWSLTLEELMEADEQVHGELRALDEFPELDENRLGEVADYEAEIAAIYGGAYREYTEECRERGDEPDRFGEFVAFCEEAEQDRATDMRELRWA